MFILFAERSTIDQPSYLILVLTHIQPYQVLQSSFKFINIFISLMSSCGSPIELDNDVLFIEMIIWIGQEKKKIPKFLPSSDGTTIPLFSCMSNVCSYFWPNQTNFGKKSRPGQIRTNFLNFEVAQSG